MKAGLTTGRMTVSGNESKGYEHGKGDIRGGVLLGR